VDCTQNPTYVKSKETYSTKVFLHAMSQTFKLKKPNPNDKNSEIKSIRLPLFFVDLVPQENNKDR